MTTKREEFEAYMSNNGRGPRSLDRDGEGYRVIQTQSAWNTWQAACAPLLEMIKNLEGILKDKERCAYIGPIRDCPTHGDLPELSAARARIAELEQSAEYAWKTAKINDEARMEEMRKRDSVQAKLDAVMLEHCPDEMSKEQLEEWARHQQPVTLEQQLEIEASLKEE